ncbi:I78 family peptidase inhibitor [Crenalkalicoccus roseus]|uniref:I78 family peptidase inhibitor n=1 Tax=Crenalkalicoccus roseus TaxID=1485588 RepID=UPI00107FFC1E|nr:I78 family peptidase inhibitor [Crenalkalicoccus roseus]
MRRPARAAGLALLLAALGCAQAAPPGGGECARNEDRFPALLGRPAEEARAALERMPGIRTVRMVGPDDMVTMDHRPDRVTVRARGGRVESIRCG